MLNLNITIKLTHDESLDRDLLMEKIVGIVLHDNTEGLIESVEIVAEGDD